MKIEYTAYDNSNNTSAEYKNQVTIGGQIDTSTLAVSNINSNEISRYNEDERITILTNPTTSNFNIASYGDIIENSIVIRKAGTGYVENNEIQIISEQFESEDTSFTVANGAIGGFTQGTGNKTFGSYNNISVLNTYTNIQPTNVDGTGTSAKLNISPDDNKLNTNTGINAIVTEGGSGYQVGDILKVDRFTGKWK